MYRKLTLVIPVLLFVILLAPYSASAVSVGGTAKQLEAFYAKIEQLKKQLADLRVKNPGGYDNAPTICPFFRGSLRKGHNGPEVLAMQQFLIKEGDLERDLATGHFGAQTEKAVRKWQMRNKVVSSGDADTTGYGVLGPKTRAAMRVRCNSVVVPADGDTATSTRAGNLTVTPGGGKAPLTVTLKVPRDVQKKMADCKYSIGFYGASGNGLTVNWGDGSVEPNAASSTNNGKSCTDAVKKHTYTEPGRYILTVTSWHPGPADAPVTDWMGRVEIVVTKDGSTATTTPDFSNAEVSLSPLEGDEPLEVTLSAKLGGRSLYQYYVDFGEEERERISCYAPTDACRRPDIIEHEYDTEGEYEVEVYAERDGTKYSIKAFEVTVTD